MFYLLTIIFINCFQGFLNVFVGGDISWHLYDIVNQITIIFSLIFAFSYISYKKAIVKRWCFAAILFFILNFIDYFLTMFDIFWPQVILLILTIFLIKKSIGVIPKGLTTKPKTDSFLVYYNPTDFFSLIYSFIFKPLGHCFLVVDKRKFVYNKGVLVEVDFLPKKNYLYLDIDTKLESARPLVGKRWSLTNNCFNTFEGIESCKKEKKC